VNKGTLIRNETLKDPKTPRKNYLPKAHPTPWGNRNAIKNSIGLMRKDKLGKKGRLPNFEEKKEKSAAQKKNRRKQFEISRRKKIIEDGPNTI